MKFSWANYFESQRERKSRMARFDKYRKARVTRQVRKLTRVALHSAVTVPTRKELMDIASDHDPDDAKVLRSFVRSLSKKEIRDMFGTVGPAKLPYRRRKRKR
jgi:hypothetical protein